MPLNLTPEKFEPVETWPFAGSRRNYRLLRHQAGKSRLRLLTRNMNCRLRTLGQQLFPFGLQLLPTFDEFFRRKVQAFNLRPAFLFPFSLFGRKRFQSFDCRASPCLRFTDSFDRSGEPVGVI